MDDPKEGSSRVLTQFLGHIVRGEPIKLVDGGSQTRAFTFIDDAVECLTTIIDNPGGIADGKIYNIGNPHNSYSIRELAEMMLEIALRGPSTRRRRATPSSSISPRWTTTARAMPTFRRGCPRSRTPRRNWAGRRPPTCARRCGDFRFLRPQPAVRLGAVVARCLKAHASA
jgi:nucleoside-diphosphate-sugar epimerase